MLDENRVGVGLAQCTKTETGFVRDGGSHFKLSRRFWCKDDNFANIVPCNLNTVACSGWRNSIFKVR